MGLVFSPSQCIYQGDRIVIFLSDFSRLVLIKFFFGLSNLNLWIFYSKKNSIKFYFAYTFTAWHLSTFESGAPVVFFFTFNLLIIFDWRKQQTRLQKHCWNTTKHMFGRYLLRDLRDFVRIRCLYIAFSWFDIQLVDQLYQFITPKIILSHQQCRSNPIFDRHP